MIKDISPVSARAVSHFFNPVALCLKYNVKPFSTTVRIAGGGQLARLHCAREMKKNKKLSRLWSIQFESLKVPTSLANEIPERLINVVHSFVIGALLGLEAPRDKSTLS
ncbi:hypothetical protein OROHE_003526 [Orobanche hederae]